MLSPVQGIMINRLIDELDGEEEVRNRRNESGKAFLLPMTSFKGYQ
jgi:hypothetical protein